MWCNFFCYRKNPLYSFNIENWYTRGFLMRSDVHSAWLSSFPWEKMTRTKLRANVASYPTEYSFGLRHTLVPEDIRSPFFKILGRKCRNSEASMLVNCKCPRDTPNVQGALQASRGQSKNQVCLSARLIAHTRWVFFSQTILSRQRLKDISTPDFSTMNFSTAKQKGTFQPQTFQPWTFQHQISQPRTFQPQSGVEKFGVESSWLKSPGSKGLGLKSSS